MIIMKTTENKVILGVDPDSSKSGIATYINGKLAELTCLSLIDIYFHVDDLCIRFEPSEVELHIENVKANKAVWHNKKGSQAAYGMTCQKVGQCKQVQTEIERIAEHFGIKVVRHQVSKMWKDSATGKAVLNDLGWTGQSNEDSRSAAYFGYLGVKQSK